MRWSASLKTTRCTAGRAVEKTSREGRVDDRQCERRRASGRPDAAADDGVGERLVAGETSDDEILLVRNAAWPGGGGMSDHDAFTTDTPGVSGTLPMPASSTRMYGLPLIVPFVAGTTLHRRSRCVRPATPPLRLSEDSGRRAGQHVVGRVVDDEEAEQPRVGDAGAHLGPMHPAVNRLENAAEAALLLPPMYTYPVLAHGRPDGAGPRGRGRCQCSLSDVGPRRPVAAGGANAATLKIGSIRRRRRRRRR